VWKKERKVTYEFFNQPLFVKKKSDSLWEHTILMKVMVSLRVSEQD